MDNLPVVEDVVAKNIFIYDIDIQDGDFVGELARRSIGKYQNTLKLLRYYNHIIYVNIDNFFKCFRCPTKQTTSTSISYDAKIESKTFTPKIFILYERRYLKNWMGSILSTQKNKPYSKMSLFLTLNQFACHPKN